MERFSKKIMKKGRTRSEKVKPELFLEHYPVPPLSETEEAPVKESEKFMPINTDEIDWQDGETILGLPPGLEAKIIAEASDEVHRLAHHLGPILAAVLLQKVPRERKTQLADHTRWLAALAGARIARDVGETQRLPC